MVPGIDNEKPNDRKVSSISQIFAWCQFSSLYEVNFWLHLVKKRTEIAHYIFK
jgi:hypothetical protein